MDEEREKYRKTRDKKRLKNGEHMEIMEIDQNRLEKLMKSHEVLIFFPPKSYGTVSEVITAAFSQISAGGQRRWRGLQRAHRSVPRAHGPWNPSPWNGQRHESLEPLMFQEFS